MKTLPHKPKPASQLATASGTGITKEDTKPTMNYQISDVKIPSGTALKEEDDITKAIYDASIAVPPAKEIEEEIILRESQNKAYEEALATQKRKWITRKMADFEDPDAGGDSQVTAPTTFLDSKSPPPSPTGIKTEKSNSGKSR